MSIGSTIFSQLTANTAIAAAVGTNVFPEFRSDVVPSIVYDPQLKSQDDSYDTRGASFFELTISAVAADYPTACSIGDAIFAAIDNRSWSDSANVVMGCWMRDRNEGEVPLAGKTTRLFIVDVIFDLTVKAAS